jgi:hypothetical protein
MAVKCVTLLLLVLPVVAAADVQLQATGTETIINATTPDSADVAYGYEGTSCRPVASKGPFKRQAAAACGP